MPLSTRRPLTRRTPRDLFGSIGLFIIAEFVAHDSRLRYSELESRLGQRHQPAVAYGVAPLMR
jgi:hypothetical protein